MVGYFINRNDRQANLFFWGEERNQSRFWKLEYIFYAMDNNISYYFVLCVKVCLILLLFYNTDLYRVIFKWFHVTIKTLWSTLETLNNCYDRPSVYGGWARGGGGLETNECIGFFVAVIFQLMEQITVQKCITHKIKWFIYKRFLISWGHLLLKWANYCTLFVITNQIKSFIRSQSQNLDPSELGP